jgi:cob(I)alamin adenosyltransferase
VNIEEILNRLERIDHKEYRCGFEFADSSTFNEMARCFEERKILAKEIERLNNIINELEKWLEEAIETISHISLDGASGLDMALTKIKELKGSDKE